MADADDELAALMGGCSLGAGAPGFWTPDMVGYFELVKPVKAETESLFAAIGELARQQAAVVAGEAEGTPDQAMGAVGRLDAQLGARCARPPLPLDSPSNSRSARLLTCVVGQAGRGGGCAGGAACPDGGAASSAGRRRGLRRDAHPRQRRRLPR